MAYCTAVNDLFLIAVFFFVVVEEEIMLTQYTTNARIMSLVIIQKMEYVH